MTHSDDGVESRILYRPTKSDILPLALLFFCTIFAITVSALSYILVDAQSRDEAIAAVRLLADKGMFNLQNTVNSTRRVVSSVNSLFSIENGNIDQGKQFIPFLYSDNGQFPPFLQRVFYLTLVTHDQFDNFTDIERKRGGPFSNFTIYSRDVTTSTILPANKSQAFFLPVTHYSHEASVALLGYDHFSDAERIPYINRAIDTNATVTSVQVSAARNTVGQVVVQYSPVLSSSDKKLIGFVAPIFTLPVMFSASLALEDTDFYASVSDLNETQANQTFMYNTIQSRGAQNGTLKPFTQADNDKLIRESRIAVSRRLNFGDRVWEVTFIPTIDFVNRYRVGINKWIGMIVSIGIWVIVLGLCVFLFCYKRLRSSVKAREASETRVRLISKFMPTSFLNMIRCKSVRHYRPGVHRVSKLVMVSVCLDHFDNNIEKHSHEMMTNMNNFYKRVKHIAREYDGFIYRFEGVGFICLFSNEIKGLNAALMMHNSLGSETAVHVAVHKCNMLSGILGDNESLLAAVITDHLDLLKRLAMLCRKGKRKIVISGDIVDALKKTVEKQVAYVGRVERHSENGAKLFLEAYQLLAYVDPSKISIRRRYGVAKKKIAALDFVAAKEILDGLVDIEKTDGDIRQTRESVVRTLSLCIKIREVWTLQDTIGEMYILGPTFKSFCEMEFSLAELQAWTDLKGLRQLSIDKRQEKISEILKMYCDQGPLLLKETFIMKIHEQVDSTLLPTFDDIIVELEHLTVEAHNRFKRSPIFLNSMYSLMINSEGFS